MGLGCIFLQEAKVSKNYLLLEQRRPTQSIVARFMDNNIRWIFAYVPSLIRL